MRFSRAWLATFCDVPDDAELARSLTTIGHAVEGVEQVGGDTVFDVDVTSNRPDAMCHLGLARDLAVRLGVALRLPSVPTGAPAGEVAGVRVELPEPRLCPRYSAHVLRGVTIGPSPGWLVDRLAAIGQRSINNVVDVTNYVMWELGQPLHAFDLATLRGGVVTVRSARAGETLVTLDGAERKLDPEILVIADGERAIALAGVMGGLATEVTAGTTDLLLESAHFARAAVRRTAKRLGMHTDASHRFERGSDPLACVWAARRAAELMLEVAGGRLEPVHVDAVAGPDLFLGEHGLGPKPTVPLIAARLDRFAGIAVPPAEVERILGGLGFGLRTSGAGAWEVSVPSWRWYDVELVADLYEEVLRIVGLDAIPPTLPRFVGPDAPPAVEHLVARKVRDHLAACGLAEAIHYAFQAPEAAASVEPLASARSPRLIANPLSERHNTMRRSLLPGLLEGARFNQRREQPAVRLFEVGHVFLDEELETVALVLGGRLGTPWERAVELDLYDLKGVVDSLAEACGVAFVVEPVTRTGFVPGRTGVLRLAQGPQAGRLVGHFGELAAADLVYPLYGAELLTSALVPAGDADRVVPPSRHPGIAVDLTLTHALSVSWQSLAAAVDAVRRPEMVRFALKDRYRGKGVPEGAVNTTVAFYYNADERSLTQEEVNGWHQAMTTELVRRYGWAGPPAGDAA
jgi:phenylalanyl-tRNA synthetase beta chain